MYLPFLASFTAGLHILSLKLLSLNKFSFVPLISFIVFTMFLSRYLIYESMKNMTNPTIMHLILNLSVFVTFFGSLFLLKVRDFRPEIFFIGIVFFILGSICIHYSYKTI